MYWCVFLNDLSSTTVPLPVVVVVVVVVCCCCCCLNNTMIATTMIIDSYASLVVSNEGKNGKRA